MAFEVTPGTKVIRKPDEHPTTSPCRFETGNLCPLKCAVERRIGVQVVVHASCASLFWVDEAGELMGNIEKGERPLEEARDDKRCFSRANY